MSDPRYHVARRVDAPPDAVLAAIRDALATGWRGDPPLRHPKGTRGVRGKVRDERFTAWLDGVSERDDTRLLGTVHPADGGSDVRASVLDEPGANTAVVVLLGLAAIAALAGIGGAWWIAGFAALGGIVTAVRRASGAINHREAAFLRDWLNAVLDRVQSSSPMPASNDPALPGIPA